MTDSAKVIRLEPDAQRQVRARMARLPAAVHTLNEVGQKLLAQALESYFDAADDALFDLADRAASNIEQNVYFDSMREVRVQRKNMERRFFESIEEAFARLTGDERETSKPDGELSADALSLVQNEDLEQLVALESTIARASRDHTVALQGIAEALSRILPVEIKEPRLPLGPTVICSSAMAQIKRLDIDIKAKLVLFKLFDRLVVSQLSQVLAALIASLEQSGIRVQMPTGRGRANPAQPQLHQQNPAARPNTRTPYETDAAAGVQYGAASAEGLAQSNHSELVNLLSLVQRLPLNTVAQDGLDIERILSSVQRQRGQQVEIGRLERETMGVVQMLFQHLLQDQGLANPLKDLICRMQVPVLKMALLDKNFLVEKRHPARRLLNEMVSTALQWQNGDPLSGEEPVFALMKSTIDRILQQFDGNAEVFNDALADFTSVVEKERRRAAVLEKRTVDAEDGKARAEQARKMVADEIQLRTQAHHLPDLVHTLIRGPWSNVMFVTGLKYGFDSGEWLEQLKVLNDLVWSVQICQAKSDRQRLIRLIPDLIQRLRRGLDSISYNPFEVAELFTGLEEIHLARIRGERLPLEALQDEPAPAPSAVAAEPPPAPAAQPELPVDDAHMQMVATFAPGAWFDLRETDSQEMLRCRLAAFIKPTGKYIFVNRTGVKVAEKTQVELAKALKQGEVRPLDHSQLFDKALESVVSSLRQTKASTKSMDLDAK